MNFIKVCPTDELWVGEMKGVKVVDKAVLLINFNGNVRAYEDRCCHVGVRMSQGTMANGRIVCRAHGWEYDAATGQGINPLSAHLKVFKTRIDQGAIWVDTSDEVSARETAS